MTLLIYLATGAIAGLLAGLFGVGGGMILVPALALVLPTQGIPAASVMQVAIATSLAVISASSISSAISHHRHGGVQWPVFRLLVPGLMAGALLGAGIAHFLPSDVLRRIVGVCALLVAMKIFLSGQPDASRHLPGKLGLLGVGSGIGALSALIGIGGGSLTVPFLSWCSVDIRKAVGTSAACGMPIAWAGMAGFIIIGWGVPGLPAWQLGYVSLAGFVGIAVTSVALAPLGAKLAHHLPQLWLKRAFGLLLLGIGLHMLWG